MGVVDGRQERPTDIEKLNRAQDWHSAAARLRRARPTFLPTRSEDWVPAELAARQSSNGGAMPAATARPRPRAPEQVERPPRQRASHETSSAVSSAPLPARFALPPLPQSEALARFQARLQSADLELRQIERGVEEKARGVEDLVCGPR